MKLSEIVSGETGCTMGYGCDRYPYTVVGVSQPYVKRGRKPKGWIKGSKYVDLTLLGDDLVWDKAPKNAIGGPVNADTGANGVHKNVWFVFNTNNSPPNRRTSSALVLPDGEVVFSGIGYRDYNRDSSF